jgi:hypothetical protein
VLIKQFLPGQQQNFRESDLGQREPNTVGAYAEVFPPRIFVGDRFLLGEVCVSYVEDLRREDVNASPVQCAHLVLSVTDRGGRGDDQRTDALPTDGVRRQQVDSVFEQPNGGTERARDQVELVLDDQVGRA